MDAKINPQARIPLQRLAKGVVIIGVSTGGPRALENILPRLPADFAWPVVVIQHMPKKFTETFARRMGQYCALKVEEVTAVCPIVAGTIYIAQGNSDAVLRKIGGRIHMMPEPEDADHYWHPSVSRMVASAIATLPPSLLIGVQLTGMGNDGAEEMARLHAAGGRTIAESEASSVVFGMPRELIRRQGATEILDAQEVAPKLIEWVMGK
jgi:two-component system chemotaxis response regulator CheB